MNGVLLDTAGGDGAQRNRIGGSKPSEGNVISGNVEDGVSVTGNQSILSSIPANSHLYA